MSLKNCVMKARDVLLLWMAAYEDQAKRLRVAERQLKSTQRDIERRDYIILHARSILHRLGAEAAGFELDLEKAIRRMNTMGSKQ